MHFQNRNQNQNHEGGMSFISDSQQYRQHERTRYLFDLNSPPIATDPQLITGISSQLSPVTPKITRRVDHRQVVSDIINLDEDGSTDEAADKQDNERSDPEQPQLILEQSQDTISMQLEEVNGDFEEELSDDFNPKKTPQPKQRRRKHRPKVVIESKPKSAKKSTPPQPDGSSTGKRKYVRKIMSERSTETPTSEASLPKTRNSCRRKINFEEEQNLHTELQGIKKKTEIELMCDKEFLTDQMTMLSPITPNKSELRHERLAKDVNPMSMRAKRNLSFSRKAHDNDSNCSTSGCFNEDGQETRGSKRECSGDENGLGNRCNNSLEAYLSMITNFPAIYKKKRTEKCQSSVTFRAVSSIWSPEYNNRSFPETSTVYGLNFQQSYKHMLAFGHVESFRKKRSKGVKRMRDLASFAGMIEGKKSASKALCQHHTCMEALSADFSASIATKKRTKRKYIVPSSSYHNHWFLKNYTGFHPSLRWRNPYDIDALINQFESMSLNNRMVEQDQHALVPYSTRYREKNALVLYKQDKSVVPFEGSYQLRRRKPRPKVDLDDETSRVWRLLLEDINSKGIDGTDEDKEKWWEEERNVFSGRAASFIARMHLVQGDRRFSRWKGSVVDSVIGVFLTQNVSDHLSSSAFMNLAARYPLKSKSSNEPLQDDKSSISVKEPCQLDLEETIRWHEGNSNQQPAQDHGSIMLQDADSYEEKEVVNSNERSVRLKDILSGEVLEISRNDSGILESFTQENRGVDDLVSPQNSVDTCPNSVQSSIVDTAERLGSWLVRNSQSEPLDASKPIISEMFTSFASTKLHEVYSQEQAHKPSNKRIGQDKLGSINNSPEQNEGISHDHITSGLRIPPKDHELQTAHGSAALEAEYIELREERIIIDNKPEEKCASEQSEISAESASQATVEMVRTRSFQETPISCNTLQSRTISENSIIVTNQHAHENNCNAQKALDIENCSAEISEVTESNNMTDNSRETAHKIVESNSNEHGNLQTTASGINEGSAEVKKGKTRKAKKIKPNWDSLRIGAQVNHKRETTPNTKDSLDYEAVRCADVNEIADTIKDRGMNNMLAERIKDFLNRLVRDHGSIDLEWLRDVPPDKAKEYLLSFRGLGLKSVECVRLLTLHHLAFPVDTNVGRIAVRLGWVPLQPLPESLQLHLLELYPVLESIQKYLWPRLCKLDQRTLYELHYQMITFGKVFCTKNKPNCNACPMRGECRHFASAFASARLALPAPEERSIVSATENKIPDQSPTRITSQLHLTLPLDNHCLHQQSQVQNHDPVIEEPATPEPIVEVPATPEPEKIQQESDIEDFCEDPEEIPMIKLNMEAFTQNLQTYMENNMELAEGDMSRALVALASEAASIPAPKLKNVSQLRTEHQVYELPDSHPLLEGLDKREPDDPCSYLLAIWTPGETAESIQPPGVRCSSEESGTLCHKETCFSCNSIREANSQTIRGTLLIPCRTAMRGSFPLNGTYFQVNEVFADHDSSLNPIDVPRSWLWNLPRRTVYFGTSIPTIFKGLTTEGIQYCFWRGFVCVRGFDQKTRAPRPLMARLHFPASKLRRSKGMADET
ncbi:protein ROS1-like isoform X2 [Cynara cardunculus var. scolymus]|nr:protein ROS1-like isoform X2 [Cynara cardunculus var. scolymus]